MLVLLSIPVSGERYLPMLEREDGVSVIRSALSRSDIRADVKNYLMEITRRHEQWCSAGHEAEPLDDANYYFW